jgi:phosphoglycerate kinase
MELSGIRSLDHLDPGERTVFVRVDFNVPLDPNGVITDDGRIQAALPTLRALREKGARLVLGSHLGRPKGQRDARSSMVPIGARLAELLRTEIVVPDDCVGDGVRAVIRDLPPGGICLLENLRWYEAETAGDPVFASELAALAEFYVSDAFGTAHRAHASTYTMVRHFDESHRAAGLLVEKELRFLGPLLEGPERPYVGILGGAKVSDKIKVIEALLGKLDVLLIGGAMANTFLRAQGVETGTSRVEEDRLELAASLLRSAEARRTRVVLPVDHRVALAIDAKEAQTTEQSAVPAGLAAFDIGPRTTQMYCDIVKDAATVFWNGPLGVFESDVFSAGTFAVANACADSDATVVVGGGDSAAAVVRAGLQNRIAHISTGGGASLEFIEGATLPGIAALRAGHRFEVPGR